MVKIDFEIETRCGLFKDALHLEDDHGLTEEQIEVMKQKRADNWVSHVETVSTIESTGDTQSMLPHQLLGELPL